MSLISKMAAHPMNIDENGDVFDDVDTSVPQNYSTAVVVQAAAVPQRNAATGNPLKDALNAASFNYKDGIQLVASNGNITLRSSKSSKCGEWVDIDITAWKKVWVCSPGVNGAPKESVAYSDDGVNCNKADQGLLSAHLEMLKESGYRKAKIEERAVLLGYYEGSEKPFPGGTAPDEVQIDLSPTAAKAWGSFVNRLDAALSRRRIPVETASVVRFTAVVSETSTGGESYTTLQMSSPRKAIPVPMIGR